MSAPEAQVQPTEAGRPAGERPLILVGIDESEASRAAMRWALRVAKVINARIEAVAVWHLPQHFNDVPVPSCTALQDDARTWLSHAVPPDPEVPVQTVVVRGDPTAVLLERSRNAHLIVLGNHGHGPIHTAIFGSVAHRCAHRARCPVVLVPAP